MYRLFSIVRCPDGEVIQTFETRDSANRALRVMLGSYSAQQGDIHLEIVEKPVLEYWVCEGKVYVDQQALKQHKSEDMSGMMPITHYSVYFMEKRRAESKDTLDFYSDTIDYFLARDKGA